MGETEGQIPEWIPDEVTADPGNKCQLTHMFETFSALHKLQKEGSLCDITIKVDGASFQAHKVVLASCTEYFNAMFSSGFQESHQSEVTINGISEAFQILLDFAYSGQLNLSMETAIDVFEMAHYLQFDNVMERCGSFLNDELGNQRVDVRSAIKLLSVADLYGLENLKKGSKENIAKNFKTTDDFLQHMTFELMDRVLKRSDLANEKEVFDTTLAWLQHDWENRQVHAPALLQRIRLGLVPVGHLSLTVFTKFPDLYAIPECKDMINNVLKLFDANKPSGPPLYYSHPSLFATRTTIDAFLSLATNQYYSVKAAKWITLTKFPSLPEKDCAARDSCIIAQGKIYVARGTFCVTPQRLRCPQFLRLDVANSRWHTLAPMLQRRGKHSLVQIDGDIYAIGGNEHGACLCEVYSIHENKWRAITPMCHPCSVGTGSAAVYNGKIFVYARGRGVMNFTSKPVNHYLQMYDPVLDTWFLLATFRHPCGIVQKTGLLVHDGKCYRIVDAKCSCQQDGCQWHVHRIDELVINVTNKTAVVGEMQDQAVIPAEFKKRIIHINQDFLVVYRTKFCRTNIQIARNKDHVNEMELRVWSNLLNTNSAIINVAFFKFDKDTWL